MRKLTKVVDGRAQIISDPPVTVPVEELFSADTADAIYALLRAVITRYGREPCSPTAGTCWNNSASSSWPERSSASAASVSGRGCCSLEARGRRRSPVPPGQGGPGFRPGRLRGPQPKYSHQGERVVAGQHLMQAASDIFLGWTRNKGPDGVDRDFYVRQLRDWKLSFPIDQMMLEGLTVYAELCGWTLARAHARSGDRVGIAAYLGRSDRFDQAIADFAETYADQNRARLRHVQEAARTGRVEAVMGV